MALASVTSNSCLTTTSLRSQNVSFFLESPPVLLCVAFLFLPFLGNNGGSAGGCTDGGARPHGSFLEFPQELHPA